MTKAIMLGSNMFVDSNVLTVEVNEKLKEIFRIRELFRERSEGSYLTVDCDIKDSDNQREIKLFKNNPVVKDDSITFEKGDRVIAAYRLDESLVIKIEQIMVDDPTLPQTGPILEFLQQNPIDAILRITGSFYAGDFKIFIDNDKFQVGGITLSGNLSIGASGVTITQQGFSM